MAGTRHLVDPELLPMVDAPLRLRLELGSLPEDRATIAKLIALAPAPSLVAREVMAGSVPLRLFVPPGDTALRPAIFHIHGGGFVIGTAAMGDPRNARLALTHDAIVCSVDYRLAPETPFPGPLEDCYAGLAWLVGNAAELGIDPARIIVKGESAGGGLAAALALLARDRGEFRLAGQILIYPMLDHRTGTPDEPQPNGSTGEFGWTRAANGFGWACMAGTGETMGDRLGHFSPARAEDLSGLPPTFMGAGALDLLLEEDVAYALRLSRAGVPVELHVYPGAPHGYDQVPGAAVTKRAADDVDAAIARLFRTRTA